MSKIANVALEIHVQETKKALYDQYMKSSSPEDKFAMNLAISALNALSKDLELRVMQIQQLIL